MFLTVQNFIGKYCPPHGSFLSSLGALIFCLLLGSGGAKANVVVTPWVPVFKGIERAIGTNLPTTFYTNNGVAYANGTLQVANCLRIDLQDPDVRLFTSPRATNYVLESSETYSISVSNFVKKYGVQVASVANFYQTFNGNAWTADPILDGLPSRIFGLSICTGQVVSVPDFGPDSNNRYATILFTTNNTPSLALNNAPPGTNTAGIYTAVSGYYAVLTNGVILGSAALTAAYPDPTFHQFQPRTVFGLSADRRYLFMMAIDGRQTGYSEGANDTDMGFWLLQFGASDGVAMDGGGSAAMYMENCTGGNPIALNKSSYVLTTSPPRERITGSQLGVYALPLVNFIHDETVTPGTTSATISWNTLSPASTQVEYGLTPALGTLTPFEPTPVTNHTVNLNGLLPGQRYYYRALSISDGMPYASACNAIPFTTTNFASGVLVPLNTSWRYTTNNLDGANWTAPEYDDGGWSNGPACLWADSRNPVSSNYTNFVPNFASGTRMPINAATTYPFMTYYFRQSFIYSNSLEGLTLTFSNFLDDGAVFYLNGSETFRTNMPAGLITNNTSTLDVVPCTHPQISGSATCPLVFTLTGSALNNLVVGTNYYTVELHNFRSINPSPDVAFQSAVHFTLPPPPVPPPFFSDLVLLPGETNAVLTWNTLSNSTAQILYGLTPLLGSSSPLDPNLTLNHAVVLTGLQAVTTYYFQIVATNGTNQWTFDGTFTTTPFMQMLVSFTDGWRFTTNNLNGINWPSVDYDDDDWQGPGPALLYLEENVGVSPRSTPLPATAGNDPYPTYYFRTRFSFSGSPEGFGLIFTNYIDDGAVFYLNGTEIQRVRMNPGPVSYTQLSSGCPINACEATQDVPDVFRLGGSMMTNLVEGENVLAVEVHQHSLDSSDIVFGSTVSLVRSLVSETPLHITRSNDVICVSWTGTGFTLQQTNVVSSGPWPDVPGPVTTSPYCTTNPSATTFFRLRD
jgi:exopolysaccharide biosynthesis protein